MATPSALPKLDLRKVRLDLGAHKSYLDGVCVMELAAYRAGEPISDHPACVSPVIGSFLRSWNDSLPDTDRQMLKPYARKVLNTATGAADEETRAWLATDWLARECAPAFLRLAGLTAQAEALEGLTALTGAREAKAAWPTLDAARKDAAASWDASWDASRAASRAASRDASRAASRDASRAATTYEEAYKAAGAALAPTVKILQKSARSLLDRMVEVGR